MTGGNTTMSADPQILFFRPGLPLNEWAEQSRMSRWKAYNLLKGKVITAKVDGGITRIDQSPNEYRESLPAYVPGREPARLRRVREGV